MVSALPSLDEEFDRVHQSPLAVKVPVIRIFGSTPAGQNCCLHVHRYMPYLYIRLPAVLVLDDPDVARRYLLELADSIETALDSSSRSRENNNTNTAVKHSALRRAKHVFHLQIIHAVPFYGYHPTRVPLVKISLTDPGLVNRLAGLLLAGAVCGRVIQPYESHIPYLLHFMTDFNLFGMDWISLSSATFRRPLPDAKTPFRVPKSIVPAVKWTIPDSLAACAIAYTEHSATNIWTTASTPRHMMSSARIPRTTTCAIEADCIVEHILNRFEFNTSLVSPILPLPVAQSATPDASFLQQQQGLLAGTEPLVTSLASIWSAERIFRGEAAHDSNRKSQPREEREVMETESRYLQMLRNAVFAKESHEREVDSTPRSKSQEDSDGGTAQLLASLQSQASQGGPREILQPRDTNMLPVSQISDSGASSDSDTPSINDDDDNNGANDIDEMRDILECSQFAEEQQQEVKTIPQFDGGNDTDDEIEDIPDSLPLNFLTTARTVQSKDQDTWVQIPSSPSQSLGHKVPTQHTSTDDTICLSWNVPPPSVSELIRSIRSGDEDLIRYREPFFSDTKHLPQRPTSFGGRIFRLPGNPDHPRSMNEYIGVFNDVGRPSSTPRVSNYAPFILTPTTAPPDSYFLLATAMINRSTEALPLDTILHQYRHIDSAGREVYNVHELSNANPATKQRLVETSQSFCEGEELTSRPSSLSGSIVTPITSPEGRANALFGDESNAHPFVELSSKKPEDIRPPSPKYDEMHKNSIPMFLTGPQTVPSTSGGASASSSRGDTHSRKVSFLGVEVLTAARDALLPDPALDKIVAIAYLFQIFPFTGAAEQRSYGLLTCNSATEQHSCPPVSIYGRESAVNIVPICLDDELQLLEAFIHVVKLFDPDILLGYEVQKASLGYIIERAFALWAGIFPNRDITLELSRNFIGKLSDTPTATEPVTMMNDTASTAVSAVKFLRLWGTTSNVVESSKESSAVNTALPILAPGLSPAQRYAQRKASNIDIPGRIVLNIWRLLRSEVKLNIYSLQNVAYHVLGVRLPSFSTQTLWSWYSSPQIKYSSFALSYLMRRCLLTVEILVHLDVFGRTAELAKVFGISFYSVLSRGSQYRVESMLVRLTKRMGYVLISPSRSQVSEQPAMECQPLIMEPDSRLYSHPVIVLDFQSLYPSIVIAYNLCFSTCLGKISAAALRTHLSNMQSSESEGVVLGASTLRLSSDILKHLLDQIWISPNGIMFAKPNARRGILPRLLKEILDTRVLVKQWMKLPGVKEDVSLYRMLNAQQYGLKMIANVTYGYTAAGYSGRMPMAELADTIVQTARETLEKAIRMVEADAQWKAKVVYGDTDSLFVLLPGRSRAEAFQIGEEIAAKVTRSNPNPIRLQFEKVYHPCFLLSKKRYVGYSYESPSQKVPVFDAKGIETIRRDSCPLVAKVMEKAIRVIFESKDLSALRTLLEKVWTETLAGQLPVRDFIFAKEVRLGTYSGRGPPPPAAVVAQKALLQDPRAEPLYAERVRYVVVNGHPNARLVDIVVCPEDFLADHQGKYQLNALYYITKQINPALSRVFNLVGADIDGWFASLHRPRRVQAKRRKINSSTMDSFYSQKRCVICGHPCGSTEGLPVCASCAADHQCLALVMHSRVHQKQLQQDRLMEICMCCNAALGANAFGVQDGFTVRQVSLRDKTIVLGCESLDCPVFFERARVGVLE